MKPKLRGRPPGPRDYKDRTPNQARFLKAYGRVGMIGVAAEMAGISRRSHVKWMHKEPAYPKLFLQAHEQACYALVAKVRRLTAARMAAMNREARLQIRRAIARRQEGGRFARPDSSKLTPEWELSE